MEEKRDRTASDLRELRTIVIKNLNTVGKLETAVRDLSRAVSAKERQNDRRPLITMLVIVFFIIVSFFFYFRREVVQHKDKIDIMERQEEYLKKDLDEMKEKFFDMESSDIQAYNLYVALKEGAPDKAFKCMETLILPLSLDLSDWLSTTKSALFVKKLPLKNMRKGTHCFVERVIRRQLLASKRVLISPRQVTMLPLFSILPHFRNTE